MDKEPISGRVRHPESIQDAIDFRPPMRLCDGFDRFGVDQCLRKAGAGDEMLDAEGKERLACMYRRACWFIPKEVMACNLIDALEYFKCSAIGRGEDREVARINLLIDSLKEVKQYLSEPK